MNKFLRFGLTCAGLVVGVHATAQVTFYEREDYKGRSFTATGEVDNLRRQGFNDRASSAVVKGNRWDRWEVCEDSRFRGRCVTLQPGQYASLAAMGLNDRVSSVRALERSSPPVPPPAVTGQIDL